MYHLHIKNSYILFVCRLFTITTTNCTKIEYSLIPLNHEGDKFKNIEENYDAMDAIPHMHEANKYCSNHVVKRH